MKFSKESMAALAMAGVIITGGSGLSSSNNVHANGLGDDYFRVNTKSTCLRVREKPTTKSKVIRKLAKGSKVRITDINGNSWGKVETGGWVSMDYLKVINTSQSYEQEMDREAKIEKQLFTEERNCEKQWKGEYKQLTVTSNCYIYEHGSDLYKPLFKLKKGDVVNARFVLGSSPYLSIEYKNVDGNVYHGYIAIANTNF